MNSKPTIVTALSALLILIAVGKGAGAAGQSDAYSYYARLTTVHHAKLGPTRWHVFSDGRYDAPVGHRQPRQKDLPPAVRRAEGKISEAQRDFDRRLRICQLC